MSMLLCRINTEGVIHQVKCLFNGHVELILGFNTFLPKVVLPSCLLPETLMKICLYECFQHPRHMSTMYFQGYEITMQDLVPEEDKVSSCPLPIGRARLAQIVSTFASFLFRHRVDVYRPCCCCSPSSLWNSTRLSTM